MNSFQSDLERGIQVEEKLVDILIEKYPCTTIIKGFKGYDIWIPEKKLGIESKLDLKSNETGNIVVEIEMYDKPSGLMTTTADYWVFYDGKTFEFIKPMDIIRCIFDCELTYRKFVSTGDTKPKKAFLIKKDILYKYSSKTLEELLT
jgi:hypothetical protein